jgi:predicted phage terminase large subunit-like protein
MKELLSEFNRIQWEIFKKTVLLNKYIPHKPSEKQTEFLLLPDPEALYGGAAGGGKSDALLMAALQYVEVPEYAAILFRRSYADLSLPGALMDRASEWLTSSDAHWVDLKKTWIFPSGSTLSFGYLENENDKYRYQSAEFQFVGFDELTQFTESQYTYLYSRLRRLENSKIPIRMRAASNPGGKGHEWVKNRFNVLGLGGKPFIPARLSDNPHIDQEEYEKSLNELDHITRAQLKDGDWKINPDSTLFQREWFEIVDDYPRGYRTVRWWDLAATEPKKGRDPDYTAGCLVTEKDGIFYIIDMKHVRKTPLGVEQLIRQTAELDTRSVEIFMEQEPGSSGVNTIDHYAREVLKGFTFTGIKTTGSKSLRAKPLSSATEHGNVKLVRGVWNEDFLSEAEAFPIGTHDDQVDAASGAHEQLSSGFTPSIADDVSPIDYFDKGEF